MLCHFLLKRQIRGSVRSSASLTPILIYSVRMIQSKISTTLSSESSSKRIKNRLHKNDNKVNKHTGSASNAQTPIERSLLNHDSYPNTNFDVQNHMNDNLSLDKQNPSEEPGHNDDFYDSEGSPASSFICSTPSSEHDSFSRTSSSADSSESLESKLRKELLKCISNLPPKYKNSRKTSSIEKHKFKEIQSLSSPPVEQKTKTAEPNGRKKEPGNIYLSVEEAIELVNKREYTLISIDNEFFERSISKVMEIGISIYSPTYQKFALFPHFLNLHFIIKEFINLRNGLFVPDSKMNNITGQSLIIAKEDIPRAMSLIFEILGPKICIVGHNVSGDLKSFKNLNYELPPNLKIIDTMPLWYSFVGSSSGKSSLSYILDKLNIPNAFLHNGVNDAYFTLVISLMLTSPELRNNLALKKPDKTHVKVESSESDYEEYDTASKSPNQNENPPDFSSFPAEIAKIKLNRWLRKKTRAEEKAKKSILKKSKETSAPVHIRCSIDGKAILQKQQMGLSKNKSGKLKNPPSNKFFKPVDYEEAKLSQRLEELNL